MRRRSGPPIMESDAADVAVAGAATPPPARRRIARRAVLVLLAAFAIWAIVRYREELLDAIQQLSPWMVVAAFVPAYLALFVSLFLWRELLADLGYRLPIPSAARIFFMSQLGKYVPGSVWSIAMQVELSRDHAIPRRTNVSTGVIVIAVSIASGLSVAAIMLPFSGSATIHKYWWIALIVPVFVAGLHPKILGYGLNTALRLIRRPPLPQTPTLRGMARLATIVPFIWLMLGLECWLLLIGVGAPVWSTLPVAIGGIALAYSLGQLAVGFPAGAGVREAALTVALSSVVPAQTALVVALLHRVILTVVDLSLAGLQGLLGLRNRPVKPAGAVGGNGPDGAPSTLPTADDPSRRLTMGTAPPPPLAPRARLRWSVVSGIVADVAPKTILELGCGMGSVGARLTSYGTYTAAEPDETSWTVAEQRIAPRGGTVIRGDHSILPAGQTFDLVCAFEVLEHIEDDAKALSEWFQLIRPGGHLLLSVPADPARFGEFDVLAGHYRRYTAGELRQRLEEAGAVDIDVRHYGWPLGYLLDSVRQRLARGKTSNHESEQVRTHNSGRLFQPRTAAMSAVIATGVAPFQVLQRMRPGAGDGLIALARRAPV